MTNLLQADLNYCERGMARMLFTAVVVDRFAAGTITSRIRLAAPATAFDAATDLVACVIEQQAHEPIACVLLDEAQFLTANEIAQLAHICDVMKVPVLADGLRTGFQGRLFE